MVSGFLAGMFVTLVLYFLWADWRSGGLFTGRSSSDLEDNAAALLEDQSLAFEDSGQTCDSGDAAPAETEEDYFARLAMQVKIRCEIAGYFAKALLDDPSDAKARERYIDQRNVAIALAVQVHDEFAQAFAVAEIVKLCAVTDDLETAVPLFRAVTDPMLRENILREAPALARHEPVEFEDSSEQR